MPMTSDRFVECLDIIDWTLRGIAARIDVSERQVRRWASGVYPIPDRVGDWLERIARFHQANPPPPPPERIRLDRAEVIEDA
jgi:hypothetical protein